MSPETPKPLIFEATPAILTEEELKAQQRKLEIEAYIAKIRAKIEYQKKVVRNKYHTKKKTKAAMKKKSQQIGRLTDKKYLKRKAKRDFKTALKNAKIVVVHDTPTNG